MKFAITILALLGLFNLCNADINISKAEKLFEEVEKTPLVMSNPGLVQKVREKVFNKGCATNVCFALDGSGSIGDDFQTQKDFVKLIGAIVGADDNSNFAATVYGLVNKDISKLTNNAEKFLLDVCEAPFPGSDVTFISAGLAFCFNQLNDPPQRDDVNKIVLLGDGFSNFGDIDGDLAPVSIAKQWRELFPGNALCAVAVGFSTINGLARITGDRSLVLEVKDWPILLNILDSLVEDICFVKPPIKTPPPPPPCPCSCKKKKIKAEKQCGKKKWSKCIVKSCPGGFWCC